MDPGFRARFRQFLERQGPLDDIFNDGAVILSVAKNNETSTKYRNKGNRKYKRNNEDASLAALTAYNKSICFATSGSEELAMAYANRSAVYLTLHEYDKCLENIELARTNGALSPALAEKLQRREVECNQLLQAIVVNTCQWPVTPSLSHPSNPNIPFVSSCLEVRSDPKYGRHVITNRDLAVGDIVAIESPFCTIVPKAKLYERCEHCYRENSMSLIPCNGCTAVMFCSQRCRDEAHTQYHRFECPIIDYIHSSMEDRVDLLPMRMTVCAIMSFASTDELLTFLTEARGVDNNVFRCNLAAEIDGKQRYGPVYAMQSAKPGEMVDESVCWQRLASILFAMVEMSPLHEYLTDETMAPLVDLLKHHMLVAPINASSTWDMTDDCETEPETVIAGIYPFRSLLSHSCAPNIWTTACGNKVIVSIIRTTNAGDQLFDSYGCCHLCDPIEVRRMDLSFVCDCIACQENWPMSVNMNDGTLPDIGLTNDAIMESFDRNIVDGNLATILDYLRQHDMHYPSKQLITAQNIFAHLYDLKYGIELPLCVRFNPEALNDSELVY